jgi:hypothetical protein
MLTGAGFVTVTEAAGLAVGVTVTMYVRATVGVGVCVVAFVGLLPPPQAIRKPASGIASTESNTAIVRFRRKVRGAPSRTAQNINVPLLFHGADGV